MTYNFATDIEERNPCTGNVYYISRMTSDWAERHPLNVGDVIEGVYREFEGTEFEESREELWRVWSAVLSVSSPQGDASLYPNRGGRRRAAAMKVWLLAGDYWRRGFRTGDVLPAMVPGCRITRIDGDGRAIERYSLADRPGTAWIALFPKDLHLLEDAPAEVADAPALEGHTDITDGTDSFEAVQTTPDPSYSGGEAAAIVIEAVGDQSPAEELFTEPENNQAPATDEAPIEASAIEPEPIEAPAPIEANANGEATDPRDAQIAELQARIAELEQQTAEQSHTDSTDNTDIVSAVANTEATPIVVVTSRPTERERNAAARRRRREQREAQRHSYEARLAQEAAEAEAYARQQKHRKIFAAVGAAAVTLMMIYFFGLLGPAVFGLLAGGLLKG